MDLNRRQLKIIAANVMAYAVHRTNVPIAAWTNDMCKRYFGRSKSFFFNRGRGFLETTDNGKRELKQESWDLLCKSTGIRAYDLNTKLVNMREYSFDTQSAIDFASHIDRKSRGVPIYQ